MLNGKKKTTYLHPGVKGVFLLSINVDLGHHGESHAVVVHKGTDM